MPQRNPKLRDARHLIQLGLVFLAGVLAFLALRQLLVPKGFGAEGHFRPDAVREIQARPVSFAGQAACADCHAEAVTARSAGRHKALSCEGCHGPLARHAADPSAVRPVRPAVKDLCVRCHERDAARPAMVPQVATAEHSGGEVCSACHQPHNPKP